MILLMLFLSACEPQPTEPPEPEIAELPINILGTN
jgi:hypothetical protein